MGKNIKQDNVAGTPAARVDGFYAFCRANEMGEATAINPQAGAPTDMETLYKTLKDLRELKP